MCMRQVHVPTKWCLRGATQGARREEGVASITHTSNMDAYLSESMCVVNGLVGADVVAKVLADQGVENVTELYSCVCPMPKPARSLGLSIFTFALRGAAFRIGAARCRMILLPSKMF